MKIQLTRNEDRFMDIMLGTNTLKDVESIEKKPYGTGYNLIVTFLDGSSSTMSTDQDAPFDKFKVGKKYSPKGIYVKYN